MKSPANSNPSTKLSLIELPNDILNTIALRAEQLGITVKHLMEHIIINSVDTLPCEDDEAFYAYLLGE